MTAIQYYLSAAVAIALLGASVYVLLAHGGPAFWSGVLFAILAIAGAVSAAPWVSVMVLLVTGRN